MLYLGSRSTKDRTRRVTKKLVNKAKTIIPKKNPLEEITSMNKKKSNKKKIKDSMIAKIPPLPL